MLFTPGHIGTLALPNRLVRSATAERMADADGRPRPRLIALYQELTRGGVGLIITGHMYVHASGKAHPEMTGIHSDEMIPGLAELADAVHREGGRVVVQINHGGMQCSQETVPTVAGLRGWTKGSPASVPSEERTEIALDARPDVQTCFR